MTAPTKRQPIPFGKYLLLDRVNIGGMAEVWRAKTFGADGFERLVAIKRILPNIAEDEEFIKMFIDEAKITVQLNHANIAQIYELKNIAGSYFIAMEYVSGKDMRAVFDRCRKRGEPAPIPLTCYVIAQSCEGLDYAHRAKTRKGEELSIVHRDVSPQNALISFEGEVKVIDFGIAKAAGKATKTQAGILKGKFGYMSPEQIRGLPLDRRSDVFAIGVCLYEMLTGERLFVGDSDFSVLEKVRKVEVLPPSHFNRRIPEHLEKIVMKALAKDVDDRYQYASELAEDLRTFMYSTGNPFARKDLAAFMKATFAEDLEKEKQRNLEYAEIKPPPGMLAAAEEGLVGAVPVAGATSPGANPSAITSIPIMVPPTVGPSQQGLPPITRPGPPMLSRPGATSAGRQGSPGATPPLRAPGGATPTGQQRVASPPAHASAPRAQSMQSLPRLTAVAPMLTNGKEEHEATIVADGAGAFDDSTGPVPAHPRPPPHEVPTDPSHPSLPRAGTGQPPLAAGPVPQRLAAAASPTLSAAAAPDSQDLAVAAAREPGRRSGGGLAIGVLVGLLVAGAAGVGVFALKSDKVTGQILFDYDVPAEVAPSVKIQVNGDFIKVSEVPFTLKVKPGKNTVIISAPGYESLVETVDVKEGGDYTALSRKLKKKD